MPAGVAFCIVLENTIMRRRKKSRRMRIAPISAISAISLSIVFNLCFRGRYNGAAVDKYRSVRLLNSAIKLCQPSGQKFKNFPSASRFREPIRKSSVGHFSARIAKKWRIFTAAITPAVQDRVQTVATERVTDWDTAFYSLIAGATFNTYKIGVTKEVLFGYTSWRVLHNQSGVI